MRFRFIMVINVCILLLLACRFTPQTSPAQTPALTSLPTTPAAQPASSTPAGTSGPCAGQNLPTTVAYKQVEGVDPNLLSLDIYAPAGVCAAPVVIWVHGGGYAIGDKANQVKDKVSLFNQHGWIFISVNYRLTKFGQPDSARYPDHYLDVAAALAWVHANIGAYGGDASKIALLGHSAGADIVSNVAVNPRYLTEVGLSLSDLKCAGPLDTEGFDKVKAGASDPDGEKAQWQNALGSNPNYLAETSASLLIQKGIGIPPMIGVVRGTLQRQQIETDFLARLAAAGISSTSIDARSLTHQEVNTRIGAAGDTVMTPPLLEFLTACFR